MTKKYYNKLPNGQWKAYLQILFKKGTKKRLFLKPGITEFWDGEARMYFNSLNEEESFWKYFDTDVLWSGKFKSKAEAKKAEDYLLDYFGSQVDMGFQTSGYTEVRKYNHELWIKLNDKLQKRKKRLDPDGFLLY